MTVNDGSRIGALSSDGRLLLLNTGYRPSTSTYLRRDGGDPIRLAAGQAVDVAPEGRSALVVGDAGELSAVPIGPGLSRRIDFGALRAEGGAGVPSPRGGVIVEARERPASPTACG